MKRDKGVAGLNILLTVIIMLFIIGFIIMIFAIMGMEIEGATWKDISNTTHNESLTTVNDTLEQPIYLVGQEYHNPVCTILSVWNATANSTDTELFQVNDSYTITECNLKFSGEDTDWNNTLWNVTYTVTGSENTTASETIRKTVVEIGDTTDWFGIIIIITAMVVLILLTVIIITTIRGSGLLGVPRGAGSGAALETA